MSCQVTELPHRITTTTTTTTTTITSALNMPSVIWAPWGSEEPEGKADTGTHLQCVTHWNGL